MLNLCVLGKCLSSNKKNFLQILIATLQLYGGLNHIISFLLSKDIMLEFDVLFITSVLYSVVVKFFFTVENLFIRWQFDCLLWYIIGEFFGNVWWMVWMVIELISIYKGSLSSLFKVDIFPLKILRWFWYFSICFTSNINLV